MAEHVGAKPGSWAGLQGEAILGECAECRDRASPEDVACLRTSPPRLKLMPVGAGARQPQSNPPLCSRIGVHELWRNAPGRVARLRYAKALVTTPIFPPSSRPYSPAEVPHHQVTWESYHKLTHAPQRSVALQNGPLILPDSRHPLVGRGSLPFRNLLHYQVAPSPSATG